MPPEPSTPPPSAAGGGSAFERAFIRFLERPRLGAWLALAAFVLSSSSLFLGFHLDDHVGRYIYSNLPGAKRLFDLYAGGYGLANGVPADTHWQIEQGWAPWWTYDRLLIQLYRPFGVASHMLDFQHWPESAWLMHLHSLLWLVLLVLVTTSMYRAALGVTVGGVAALLFAFDHTHGFVAGYICNRHSLITAVLGVMCLAEHLQAREHGRRARLLGAYVAYALAMTSGESAIAIAGYVFAYELCVSREPIARRMLAFAPYLIVTLAWRVLYTRAGLGAYGSGLYIDPGRDPVAYVRALVERAPVLVLGQFLAPPAELYSVFPKAWAQAMLALAWVFSVGLAVALWPLLRRDRKAWFWLLGALASIVPAASTYPHNRQLLFTSFGAMGLLAQLWHLHAVTLRDLAVRGVVRFSRELGGLLFFAHVIVSPLVMPITTCGIAATAPLARAAAAVGDEIAGREAIFVSAPDYFAVKLIQLLRRLEHKPLPQHFRALGFGPEHITVTRTDARTLELEYAEGILSSPFMELYRDRRIPMHVGERVELEGLVIEVLELTQDGRARRVRFSFDAPLEAPKFAFYNWADGHFEPFQVPALGERRALPPAKLELGL